MKVAEYLSNLQENLFMQSFHDANFEDMTHFLTLQLQHLNFKNILRIVRLPILKFSNLNYTIWQTFSLTNLKIRDIKVSVTPKISLENVFACNVSKQILKVIFSSISSSFITKTFSKFTFSLIRRMWKKALLRSWFLKWVKKNQK